MSDPATSPVSHPSQETLTTAWCLASGAAALVLATVILPAEFGIDPTGFGELTGLTALAQTPPQATEKVSPAGRYAQHQVTLELPAGEEMEYKLQIAKGDKLAYQWQTTGQPIHVDFHGEPAGDTSGYFESYALGDLSALEGTLTAPFDGSHGWYWRNDSGENVQIDLQLQGRFEVLGIR
ncbi:hypothetical protein ACQUQP_03305 [Marinobacterium sp. YM272]|uniref:hypothetical protein n=1 Tax=Marinobacterium sp. YM272 TaxID=3421654 RepID=UPI003D7FB458